MAVHIHQRPEYRQNSYCRFDFLEHSKFWDTENPMITDKLHKMFQNNNNRIGPNKHTQNFISAVSMVFGTNNAVPVKFVWSTSTRVFELLIEVLAVSACVIAPLSCLNCWPYAIREHWKASLIYRKQPKTENEMSSEVRNAEISDRVELGPTANSSSAVKKMTRISISTV